MEHILQPDSPHQRAASFPQKQPIPDQKTAPRVAVELPELEELRWETLFGNAHPVEVEIGMGKGGFLLNRSKVHPNVNFFGIEWANEFYKYAVDRMQRWGRPNVRIVRTDANHFIKVLCPRDSISILHVYHPDPWPKKRHHKRRLIQPAFVEAAVACLIPGGRISVQTDHAEYFEQIRTVLPAHPAVAEVPFDDPRVGVEGGRVRTNFENKYIEEGRTIYQIAVERRGQS